MFDQQQCDMKLSEMQIQCLQRNEAMAMGMCDTHCILHPGKKEKQNQTLTCTIYSFIIVQFSTSIREQLYAQLFKLLKEYASILFMLSCKILLKYLKKYPLECLKVTSGLSCVGVSLTTKPFFVRLHQVL